MAALRPRRRDRQPARLRRAGLRRARRRRAAGLGAAVVERVSCPAGSRASSSSRKGDAVHYVGNPEGVCQSTQRQVVEESTGSTACSPRSASTPRSRPASPSTRWPSGCRPRVPELTDFAQRAAGASWTSTASSSPATAASPPTACSPAGWPSAACGSSSSTTAPGTTTATSQSSMPVAAAETDQASAALVTGPQAARHARRHAGHLGRRVRPHADGPGHRPRPPHPRLLPLAGRRRHQGRHHLRRAPTNSATAPSRTSSPCTTSTPPCSTSAASTTAVLRQVPGPGRPPHRRRTRQRRHENPRLNHPPAEATGARVVRGCFF